jgi:hypothetical protein
MNDPILAPGLYERLLDEELAETLQIHPELAVTLEKLDDENEVESFSQFVANLLRQVLPNTKQGSKLALVNRLIELIGAEDGLDYTLRRRLLTEPKNLLTQ